MRRRCQKARGSEIFVLRRTSVQNFDADGARPTLTSHCVKALLLGCFGGNARSRFGDSGSGFGGRAGRSGDGGERAAYCGQSATISATAAAKIPRLILVISVSTNCRSAFRLISLFASRSSRLASSTSTASRRWR